MWFLPVRRTAWKSRHLFDACYWGASVTKDWKNANEIEPKKSVENGNQGPSLSLSLSLSLSRSLIFFFSDQIDFSWKEIFLLRRHDARANIFGQFLHSFL